MDRSRPLWEVYVIEGLESGRWALLTKYHHATIDGASGVLMLNLLNDHTPDADPPGESPPWEPEAMPERHGAAPADAGQPGAQPGQGGAGADAHRARARRGGRDHERQRGGPPGRRGDQGAHRPGNGDRPRMSLPLDRGAADAVEQVGHRPPPLRHPLDVAEQPQAAEGRHRRHAQRRRDGDLRRGPAGLPRAATTPCPTGRCGRWCRCRSAPATRPSRGRTGCPG